ncbi:MAG: tetratricopeptide repeat protein [Chloroflexi bacterium]|nr:tetratricopeptide repeat protein [Chloroflexota bacterium]
MAWRIPALEPNTLLLTHQMPIDYETDLSFTAPINWMYAPGYTRSDLPYMLLYTEKRIGGSTLPALEKDIAIHYPYRTVNFNGSTSRAVVIYMPRNGCLRVLDPRRGDAEIYAREPDVLTDAIPLSDPSRIVTEPGQPARPMFFPEPEHGWCYYFTHAELASQMGDYRQAAALGDEALASNLQPEDPYEWLVFIEAYAMNGDLRTAEKLSNTALDADERIRKRVCKVWEQIQARGPVGGEKSVEIIRLSFGCNP